ncbi:hypothetical protein FHX08_004345 [Rhizobium sp. BK529]|uniref:hypothetical protein n=1 Tax=unclassified Rhizobium TaxID=2613769 RepID=UPI00104D323C|nr:MULTISPECIES: hypothetical protein [unclassified Rhizobium]MBB3593942.1 hypothetical protein [Rhizobium sp. BK529]TCS01398.1 hypothetical protein EV281_106143 [Rhizobium sp. BK418]
MRKENINRSAARETTAVISAAHLLHPAINFEISREVLSAEDVGKDAKPVIPASEASELSAIEPIPALRLFSETDKAVSRDEAIEALKTLEKNDRRSQGIISSHFFDIQRPPRRNPQRVRRLGSIGLCSYRKGGCRRQSFEI